jgi:membrane-anchored glycerophosphoryl diester phosphodiesterase (GDPDase)
MIAIAIPFGLLLSNLLVDYFSSGMDNSIFLDFEGYFYNTNGLLALLFAMILGFYFSAAYFLAVPFLVFYKMGVWEAMEASRKVFNKNVFSYLVIFILLILLNIGGTIAILVGLLVTIPISAYVTYTVFAQVADLPDDDEDGLLEELQEE